MTELSAADAKFSNIVRVGIRTTNLIQVAAVAMFALYTTLQKSVADSIGEKEYLYLSLFARVCFFAGNIMLLRIPHLVLRLAVACWVVISFITVMDVYYLVVSLDHLFIATTQVMRVFFLASDAVFMGLYLSVMLTPLSVLSAYVARSQQDGYDEWDQLRGGNGKDMAIRGVFATVAPVDLTVFVFYFLSMLSLSNANVTGWVYMLNPLVSAIALMWLFAERDSVVIYGYFVSLLFFVVFLDVFELAFAGFDDYMALIVMRSVLCIFALLYVLLVYAKGVLFTQIQHVLVVFYAIRMGLFCIAVFELGFTLFYFCYADAVRVQHVQWLNVAHVLTSAAALGVWWTGNVVEAMRVLFGVALVVLCLSISCLLVVLNLWHWKSQSQVAAQGFFVLLAALHMFIVVVTTPFLRTPTTAAAYKEMVAALKNVNVVQTLREPGEGRINFVSLYMFTVNEFFELSALICYLLVLTDSAHYGHWFNYFSVVHFLTFATALCCTFSIIPVSVNINILILIGLAALALVIDLFLLAFSEHEAEGFVILRAVLFCVDLSYIFFGALTQHRMVKTKKQ